MVDTKPNALPFYPLNRLRLNPKAKVFFPNSSVRNNPIFLLNPLAETFMSRRTLSLALDDIRSNHEIQPFNFSDNNFDENSIPNRTSDLCALSTPALSEADPEVQDL